MSQGQTPFLHQFRDQISHVGLGSLVGFASNDPWKGAVCALALGIVREIFQWFGIGGMTKLKTPSLEDSIGDSIFVGLGGMVGAFLVVDWAYGLFSLGIATAAALAYALAIKLIEGSDWS